MPSLSCLSRPSSSRAIDLLRLHGDIGSCHREVLRLHCDVGSGGRCGCLHSGLRDIRSGRQDGLPEGLEVHTDVRVHPLRELVQLHLPPSALGLHHLEDDSLRIEFRKRLRGERRFPSVDDLVGQMHQDVAAVRRYFEG